MIFALFFFSACFLLLFSFFLKRMKIWRWKLIFERKWWLKDNNFECLNKAINLVLKTEREQGKSGEYLCVLGFWGLVIHWIFFFSFLCSVKKIHWGVFRWSEERIFFSYSVKLAISWGNSLIFKERNWDLWYIGLY